MQITPNAKFDLDLASGRVAEQLLRDLLTGQGSIEVKRDSKVGQTGNVAVETHFDHRPSGITQSTADWWAFVLSGEGFGDEVAVLIKTDRLRRLIQGQGRQWKRTNGGDSKAAQMILVPLHSLLSRLTENR